MSTTLFKYVWTQFIPKYILFLHAIRLLRKRESFSFRQQFAWGVYVPSLYLDTIAPKVSNRKLSACHGNNWVRIFRISNPMSRLRKKKIKTLLLCGSCACYTSTSSYGCFHWLLKGSFCVYKKHVSILMRIETINQE